MKGASAAEAPKVPLLPPEVSQSHNEEAQSLEAQAPKPGAHCLMKSAPCQARVGTTKKLHLKATAPLLQQKALLWKEQNPQKTWALFRLVAPGKHWLWRLLAALSTCANPKPLQISTEGCPFAGPCACTVSLGAFMQLHEDGCRVAGSARCRTSGASEAAALS